MIGRIPALGDPVTSWTLTWEFASGQRVTQAWNATASQSGGQVTEGSGCTPRAGECSREIHARYWTYGPDGKVYPTWHPPRDASGCAFGHEHGDDPRTSELSSTAKWPYFGYTSEVMMSSNPGGSHRHEDHVGHKVLAVNNSNVIQVREVPFDTNDLHEFWFSDVSISTSQLTFTIQPLFYVLNPSRYYDESKPRVPRRSGAPAGRVTARGDRW